MQISKKSSVVAMTIASAASLAVNFISNILFARLLSVNDIGTYRQTILVFQIVTPLITLGIPNALYYFLTKNEYKENEKKILISNITILFVPAIIFSIFITFGGNIFFASKFNNPFLKQTLLWQIPRPMLTIPFLGITSILIIHNKAYISSLYSILSSIFTVMLCLSACYYSRSYDLPLKFGVIANCITLPILLWIVFKDTTGKINYIPDFKLMKEMFCYGIPMGISLMLGTILQQFNSVIVSSMGTPSEYAIYSTGAREIPFLGHITSAVTTVILADMSIKCNDGNYKDAVEIFRKSVHYLSFIMFPAAVFFLFYSKEFIVSLYTIKYEKSIIYSQIYILLLPLRIAHYSSGFLALGKTKAIMYRSIGTVIIGISFCIIGMYWKGSIGACIGMVLTNYLWEIPYNLIGLSRGFHCSITQLIPIKKIFVVLMISLCSILTGFIIRKLNLPPFLVFLIGGFFFFSIYGLLGIYFIPEMQNIFYLLLNKMNIQLKRI